MSQKEKENNVCVCVSVHVCVCVCVRACACVGGGAPLPEQTAPPTVGLGWIGVECLWINSNCPASPHSPVQLTLAFEMLDALLLVLPVWAVLC